MQVPGADRRGGALSDPEDIGYAGIYHEAAEAIVAKAEARAAEIRRNLKVCSVCNRSMLDWPGRTMHYSCEPGTLAGKVCTCPSGCSGSHWGDGGTPCDPKCEPCRIMRGKSLAKRKR